MKTKPIYSTVNTLPDVASRKPDDESSLVGLLGLTKTTPVGLGTYTSYKKRMNPDGHSSLWLSSLMDWVQQLRRHAPRYLLHVEGLKASNIPITFQQAQPGLTAAHHYPSRHLPPQGSFRVPSVFVTPVIPDALRLSQRPADRMGQLLSVPLELRLAGRVSVVFCWNGLYPCSGPEEVRHWKERLGTQIFDELKHQRRQLQFVHLYTEYSRFTLYSMVAKLTTRLDTLARQVPDFCSTTKTSAYPPSVLLSFVSNYDWDVERRLHLYNPELVSVLVVDPLGYVRWHCVGQPTPESVTLLQKAIKAVTTER